jgi:YjbE family integral membrane protein
MIEMFSDPSFWAAAGQIIIIDILLGGDNAILIALACRNLPAEQRKWGIIWGTAGAIVLRVLLIVFALSLLTVPYIKLVGGLLLLWIGVKLLTDDGEHGDVVGKSSMWGAVQTIIIADLVMSVDNVLGIAGAAQSANPAYQTFLVIFGLLVSIPIIVWGSKYVIVLMEKFPLVITAGAALLGWLAGGMIVTDPAVSAWFKQIPQVSIIAGIIGAIFVVALGMFLVKRAKKA